MEAKMLLELKSVNLSFGNISYLENTTCGTSILFIHSNNSTKEAFEKQFQDQDLNQKYHLLALDLPGHGNSDRHKTDYSLKTFTECVVEFCKALRLARPILVGHSLGGHVVIRASQRMKLSALTILQTPPLGTPEDLYKGHRPVESLKPLFQEQLSSTEKKAVAKTFAQSVSLQSKIEKWIDVCDPNFRKSFPASFASDPCGEVDIVREPSIPFAYFGTSSDRLINRDYVKAVVGEKNYFEIESDSHYFYFEQSEAFNGQLKMFLEKSDRKYQQNTYRRVFG